MASQTQKNSVNPKASLCHHGLVKILVMDALSKQGRDSRDFVQEITQSLEHPPLEDVPPAINDEIPPADAATHTTTPSQVNTSSPVDTPIVNDQAEGSPSTNPPSNNIDPAPTPIQEVHLRKSMWKTPKRKRGSNRPVEKEVKEMVVPPRRFTRSMMKRKKSLSPQPIDVPTEPINLSTPSNSPIKKSSNFSPGKLAETLHFANYTIEEVDQFFSDTTKDKVKVASPPPDVSTFTSKTVNSDPAAETSTIRNDDLIEKLRDDIKIAEVL